MANHLIFTDTDSLTYEIKTEDVYRDFLNDQDWFDNSDYPERSDFFDKTNKKVPGKFKDESAKVRNVEFVWLRSKMYSCLKDNKQGGRKAKGIKKNVIRQEIKHENYRETLFGGQQMHEVSNMSSAAMS